MEPEQLAEKAATLRAIYEPRYAFPEWTVHELGNGNLMKHAEMAAWPGRLGIGRVGHRELVTRNNSTGHPCLVIGMSRTLNLSMSINWRASLLPAAPAIPAPIAYIKVVAIKKLVAGFLLRMTGPLGVHLAQP